MHSKYDIAAGMAVAQAARVSGRRGLRGGFGNNTVSEQTQATDRLTLSTAQTRATPDVEAGVTTGGAVYGGSGYYEGSAADVFDGSGKAGMPGVVGTWAEGGGTSPDSAVPTDPTVPASTTLSVPRPGTPPASGGGIVAQFNALSTPAKAGVIGGAVLLVGGLFYVLKG